MSAIGVELRMGFGIGLGQALLGDRVDFQGELPE